MKKLFNPLVTAIIGMFVGAMVVSAYPKTVLGEDIVENNLNFKVSEYKSDTTKKNKNFNGKANITYKALYSPVTIYKSPPTSTTPWAAKSMITDLYKFMNIRPELTPYLFRRSYSLNFNDLDTLIKKHDFYNYMKGPKYTHDSLKIRIFPSLRFKDGENVLSLILMVEKGGVLIWDSKGSIIGKQIEIQDQMGICPIICPVTNDLFNETEWRNVMQTYYSPTKRKQIK